MISQNQVKVLLLGDNLAVGVLPAAGTQVEPANMPAGAICMVDAAGKRVVASGAVAGGSYAFVQSQGPNLPLIKSDLIDFSNVTGAFLEGYSAPTNQVTFIGYNGSSGSLPSTGSSSYFGNIVIQNEWNTYGNTPVKKPFMFEASASDTASTIASGLQLSAWNGVKKMADPYYKVERVAATTSVADWTGTGTHLYFVKGSKTVTFVTNAGVASTGTIATGAVLNVPSTNGSVVSFVATADAHVVTIGTTIYTVADAGTAQQNSDDIVDAINAGNQATATNVGGTSTTVTVTLNPGFENLLFSVESAATTAVDITYVTGNSTPIKYVVSAGASAAATFELDNPWVAESGYAIGATSSLPNATAGVTSLNGNSWGLKVTGLSKSYEPAVFRYYKYRYIVELLGDFPVTTTATYTTAASEGSGTTEQVQELERFCQGNIGNKYSITNPPATFISNAVNYGSKWNVISLSFFGQATGGIGDAPKLRQQLQIAGVAGTNTQFTDSNGLIDAIEVAAGVTTLSGNWV
jgi:hypothetical protein